MPSDIQYDTYQHYGTAAERAAFTPSPPAIATVQPLYRWYETDTGSYYTYDTSWHLEVTGGGGSSAIDPFLLMGG